MAPRAILSLLFVTSASLLSHGRGANREVLMRILGLIFLLGLMPLAAQAETQDPLHIEQVLQQVMGTDDPITCNVPSPGVGDSLDITGTCALKGGEILHIAGSAFVKSSALKLEGMMATPMGEGHAIVIYQDGSNMELTWSTSAPAQIGMADLQMVFDHTHPGEFSFQECDVARKSSARSTKITSWR
jgi:hypothetical protein